MASALAIARKKDVHNELGLKSVVCAIVAFLKHVLFFCSGGCGARGLLRLCSGAGRSMLFMRENEAICPCGVFPQFCRFVASTLKLSVFECRKGNLKGRKGQMVSLGSKTPKEPKYLQDKRKTQQDHNWPLHQDWPHIGQKN